MQQALVLVLNLGISTLGSLLGVGIWFHFDLEGKWEHRRYTRMIKRGKRLDKQDLTNETESHSMMSMRIIQLIPDDFINKKFLSITVRVWLPIIVIVALVAGLLSPLFDLSQIHGFSAKTYAQHGYFDLIAGLGGYWAAGFCSHWYHRIPLFLFIDAVTTLALVTLIG